MAVNPIETTNRIRNDYMGYLQSILSVKDDEMTSVIHQALERHLFIKGPYLEATPPFELGCTLRSMVYEGVACDELLKVEKEFEIDRPLYLHQEASFRKTVQEKHNLIVSTGTGSGKTECFMYPIINSLMQQKKEGALGAGVRALLLYPMNALANDQMKRLRMLLAQYPDITFGRYTGETLETEVKAINQYRNRREKELQARYGGAIRGVDYTDADLEPLPNEVLSRVAMRATPPHILLTNYAMLEYLLIRPKDTTFFDGTMASEWKFLVLDEAHTYKGATGTEIALLLRRLKERVCGNQKGVIQCIATSATLGNKDAFPELAKFAEDIFGEDFGVQDIVTSERKRRIHTPEMVRYTVYDYQQFNQESVQMEEETRGAWLYERLSHDARIVDVLLALEKKPRNLKDVSNAVFPEVESESDRQVGLVELISLGVMAKPDKDSAALLPARYHLFVKALEGVYVSFYPEKRAFLDRKEKYDTGKGIVSVFELADCQNCGQEYLIGNEKDGFLCPATDDGKPDYFLFTGEIIESEDVETDNDSEVMEQTNIQSAKAYKLCTICGRLVLAGGRQRVMCCPSSDMGKWVKVYEMVPRHGNSTVNTCASCGSVAPAIIKRFMTANQPATYIVANSLYSMIPPQKWERQKANKQEKMHHSFFVDEEDNQLFAGGPSSESTYDMDERGRKLLVFSDNRQEAAFFAAYMDNKYNQLMWRRLILRELRKAPAGLLVGDLLLRLLPQAGNAMLFPEGRTVTQTDKENMVATFVMKELLGFERRQGLEGSGYVRFVPEQLSRKLMDFPKWKMSSTEAWDFLCVMFDTLRLGGAMSLPDTLNPEAEEFEPRNRSYYFRETGSGQNQAGAILGYLPAAGARNRRWDYARKVLIIKGFAAEELNHEIQSLLEFFFQLIKQLETLRYVVARKLGREGDVLQLNHRMWKAIYIADDSMVHKCNRCGRTTQYNIGRICPEFRCAGTLETLSAEKWRQDPYYSRMYHDEHIIPMTAKEHTAQLERERAGELQSQFENGAVNVLSCSTTFEMGVDVGQLEAILLRNVPPETANYVQRAGRAGRRTSATAFSVTYARRNSHDLNYFNDPSGIISGKIKAPYIELRNEKIALRHVYSMVLAWFFRLHPSYFDNKVRGLTGTDGQPSILVALREELDKRPQELVDRIEKVLQTDMIIRLGIREWSFVNQLVGKDGALTIAIEAKQKDLEELREYKRIRLEGSEEGRMQYTDSITRLIRTFEEQQTLNFMASGSIIPKYGFPVDVVSLDILSNTDEAQDIELSRDLKLAISEYAPGCEVIAAGKVWTSHSLNTVKHKTWPTYQFHECPSCKKATLSEGVHPLENTPELESIPCTCGKKMKPHRFILPQFGFSTAWDVKPKNVGDARPKRFYSSEIQFGGFDNLTVEELKERRKAKLSVAEKITDVLYSPQGKLVIMNRGHNGAGLFVCPKCGYAQTIPNKFEHKNKYGRECTNKYGTNAALGHILSTDILKIEFPNWYVQDTNKGDQWLSLLYAILGGASDALDISHSDINGCLDRSGVYPVILLYDESAGGAGHVKKIYSHLNEVLLAALRRVDGHCGCGPETSCYGCLRGYENQMYHDDIARGMAKTYLEWLLFEKTNSGIVRMEIQEEIAIQLELNHVEADVDMVDVQIHLPDAQDTVEDNNQLGIGSGQETITGLEASTGLNMTSGMDIPIVWREKLALTWSPNDSSAQDFCMDLIENGVAIAPDEVGYELRSEQFGVLGLEAELVWHTAKVAVLAMDADTDAEKMFKEHGWNVYRIGVHQAADVALAILKHV